MGEVGWIVLVICVPPWIQLPRFTPKERRRNLHCSRSRAKSS